MRWLDLIRIQTLAVIALIIVFTAATVVSPYLPHMILHAQQTGLGGVPGAVSGGGGAVSSVFGRTGPVTAASGDYTASMVTNAAATNAANTFTANQAIASASSPSLTFTETGAAYVGIVAHGGFLDLMNDNSGYNPIMTLTNSAAVRLYSVSVLGFSSGNPQAGAIDTGFYRVGSGVAGFTTSESSPNTAAVLEAAAYESGGTVFTVSGCGIPTATGGATIGTFTAGSGTCNPVITPGKAANHGWVCTLQDETTSSASFRQSAHSTTTATLTGTGIASGDTIDVACGAF